MANPLRDLINKIGLMTTAQAVDFAVLKFKAGDFAGIITDDVGLTFSDNVPDPDNVVEYAKQYHEEIYVYAPVYLISNTIAGLPLKIYHNVKVNGAIVPKEIPNHPAQALFNQPNDYQSGHDMMEAIAANLMLTGRAYLLADSATRPSELNVMNAAKVKMLHVKGSGQMVDEYLYGKDKKIPTELVTYFSFFNPLSPFYGLSPIAAARYTIDTTEHARISNRNIFKNGCRIGAVVETDQTLSDEVYERMKKDFNMRYQGSEKSHKTAILEQGTKYKDIGINPKDMDYVKGMQMNREDICAAFLVPTILIGDFENASYNNILEAKKIYWQNCIVPKLDNIETRLNLIVQKFDAQAYCKFDLSKVEPLQEDMKGKVEMAERLSRMGVPFNAMIKPLGLPFDPIAGGDVPYSAPSPFGQPQPAAAAPAAPPAGEAQPQAGAKMHKACKASEWTEEKLEAKWKVFAANVDSNEKKYKKQLVTFFNEQEKTVLANLGKLKSIGASQLAEKTFILYTEDTAVNEKGEEITVHKAISIDAILFDFEDEVAGLYDISLPIHKASLKAQAQAELQALEISASFDVTNPKVVEWLEANALEKAQYVIESKRSELKASLIEGVNEGEGIPKLMERVREYYEKVDDYQVERVARTEVVGASNKGALMAYAQAGVKRKGWLAAFDERTRVTHLQAHKDYNDGIPMGDNFEVGEDSMEAPGQGSLPEENISCRCALIPIIEEDNDGNG